MESETESAEAQAPATPNEPAQTDFLAQPPETHDEPRTADPVAETPTFKKVESATSGIAEKFGQFFKRGRGRPKNDGSPKVSDIPLATGPMGDPSARQLDGSFADRSRVQNLAKRCIKAAVKAVWSVFDKVVFSRAILVTNGNREEAQKFVDATKATEQETDASAECLEILAEMYGWDPKIMALVAGLATFAGTTGRYAMAISELNAIIAKNQNSTLKKP